jgi:alpha-mannosidase
MNWDCETYWQLDCFLKLRPQRAEKVFERLREGRMELSAMFGNLLTGLCSHEALNRSTLDAWRLARKHGFSVASVILDDVPSAVSSLPMVLAGSGIKYFIEGVNNDRAPHAVNGLKSPFYWEGPDGSRVLCHIERGYAQASGLISSMDEALERVPKFLANFERPDYPYDAVLLNGAFSDNVAVANWLPEVAAQWNTEWAFPKLILAKQTDYFRYIEQRFTEKIPTVKGDFGAWWEDGAGSTAHQTALCRRAEEQAVAAEILHTLAALLGGLEYPKAQFDELWRNILLYDEHTWGAWCSISQPKSEQTVKQWEVKGAFARKAHAAARQLLKGGLDKLGSLTPAGDFVVFNPLAWNRTGVAVAETAPMAREPESGKAIASQAMPEGGYCFLAKDVPAIGYKSFQPVRSTDPSQEMAPAVRVLEDGIENDYYRISYDQLTGAIKSILDKETGRDLVDPAAGYSFGEVLYVSGGENTYAVHSDLRLPPPKFQVHRLEKTSVTKSNGPVFGELLLESKGRMMPKINLRLRLYHAIKQLDLRYEIDKTETTAKEAVYIAFPMAMEVAKGGLWLEYPDAIIEPLKEQHLSACRDWFAVQRWLAASDSQVTVILSPLDTPLVSLGGMNPGKWLKEIRMDRAHVYAYVMNNYWHTNYKAEQGGPHLFRFSLTTMRGAFSRKDAITKGWEMFAPLLACKAKHSRAGALTQASQGLVSIEPAWIPLLTAKAAEDANGFVFRLLEPRGVSGLAKVTLPVPIQRAFSTDLVEGNERPLEVSDRTVSVPLRANGLATVKVQVAR